MSDNGRSLSQLDYESVLPISYNQVKVTCRQIYTA